MGVVAMKRVLIVDDAAFMRMAIKNMIEKYDYEVIDEAENGEVAIVKYKELKPDIVTLDITMPEMSGLEALKQIMAFDPDAKVVMISAMGQQQLIMEAIKNGAKSFIVKPLKENHVIQTLDKVLN